jgi:hypothetical protein
MYTKFGGTKYQGKRPFRRPTSKWEDNVLIACRLILTGFLLRGLYASQTRGATSELPRPYNQEDDTRHYYENLNSAILIDVRKEGAGWPRCNCCRIKSSSIKGRTRLR